jgi:hypothetical protein
MHQALVLTDYLRILFQKLKAEYPNIQVSFATSCRLKPKHTLLAKYISRMHVSVYGTRTAFKVKALRILTALFECAIFAMFMESVK